MSTVGIVSAVSVVLNAIAPIFVGWQLKNLNLRLGLFEFVFTVSIAS